VRQPSALPVSLAGKKRRSAAALPAVTEVKGNYGHAILLQQPNFFLAQRQLQLGIAGNNGNLVSLINQAAPNFVKTPSRGNAVYGKALMQN